MTDQQITKIAREYAKWITEAEGGNGVYIYSEQEAAFAFLRWLLQRYCLVEKDTIRETLWKLTDKFLEDKDYKAFGAASTAIESLFPEIAKEAGE